MTIKELVRLAYIEGHLHGAAEYGDNTVLFAMYNGQYEKFYQTALADYHEQCCTKDEIGE